MRELPRSDVAWAPTPGDIENARVTSFMRWLSGRGLDFASYDELWRWSVEDINAFWLALWEWDAIVSPDRPSRALGRADMPGAEWFPGVRLNYVDQVFRHARDDNPAIIAQTEGGARTELSWSELRRQVAALAAFLLDNGIKPGDRVAALMPNIPATVVAFLAAASVGAIWTVCSPELGELGIMDRFRQVEPTVLIAVDGYRYNGKSYDRRSLVSRIRAELSSVRCFVTVPNLDPAVRASDVGGGADWNEVIAGDPGFEPISLPFDHPLWIVYSSGTTGLPKPIVHSHGGIVVEHVKLTGLHMDLRPGDRFHWYSNTGWIMWNAQVGGLLAGATICLFDGNPAFPDQTCLWRFADDVKLTFFGAGAAYYQACAKADLRPGEFADLSSLRAVGSTGSPLPPEAYRWILERVGSLWINALSGGTDFAGAFLGGTPTIPVRLGEMQCRCLGARVEAFDDFGNSVTDEVGELVCTAPMPSMPLMFWNDQNGRRYKESYFDVYPGVWRHGDWVRITPSGGAIIYGRSDATINRQGIRMGTSELYRAVEQLPEVLDSMVVDLEYLGLESYMPLFVVLRPGATLDDNLRKTISSRIKEALSARHVPNEIFQVEAIPRTFSGKKLEVPVKRLLLGESAEKVLNPETLTNPESLPWFLNFARDRAAKCLPPVASGE
jgi:acetoacetyl-CoA synthetase